MKKLYKIQSFILCFVGIGALFGGMLALSDISGASFGASTDILKGSPFKSFLIPGLFLFFVLGLGHIASYIFIKCKLKFHVYISGGVGCILMSWILIQCYILHSVGILHIIYFLLGLFESLIALYMLVKLKLFPFTKLNQSHWL